MGLFLILLILFVTVWILFVLPARRRRAQHEAMQESVDPGDEIITAGGIHGTVVELVDDTARVEIAPSVVVTLDRRAIAAVAREIEEEPEPVAVPEEEPRAAEPGKGREPR
jgi:preprotein translocase subunit YajC